MNNPTLPENTGDHRYPATPRPGTRSTDTVLYQGNAADYQISFNPDGSIGVTGVQSADTLISIERVRFDDGALALDTGGIAGQAYRIYQAAFDRTPDGAGLSYWIKAMDDGVSLIDVATGFVGSQEFATVYGASPTRGQNKSSPKSYAKANRLRTYAARRNSAGRRSDRNPLGI